MEQTVNIFTGGMLLDSSPITLKNDTLYDVLNGTFITMNGNEAILQNDMGNRRVENAFLPSGYEPVGIKEHGGVIYIASYNPITNRGLIGSFPSPERRINPINKDNDDLLIDLNFYNSINSVEKKFSEVLKINIEDTSEFKFIESDSIISTYLKYPLHIGDKFAIYGDTSSFIFKNSANDTKGYSLVSNYYNTKNGKIYSPKNNLFTLSVGVLNSQNVFVDITELLNRYNNGTEVKDPKILDYNDGYFILDDIESSWETEQDTNFLENRNLVLGNTYNYKLVGPLSIKTKINHFDLHSFYIYAAFEELSLPELQLNPGDNPSPGLLQTPGQLEGVLLGTRGGIVPDTPIVDRYDFINPTTDVYNGTAQLGYDDINITYEGINNDKYVDLLECLSSENKTFDAYDLFIIENGNPVKQTCYKLKSTVIKYNQSSNNYECTIVRKYYLLGYSKNGTLSYIIAPKLIDNDGIPFGGNTTTTSIPTTGEALTLTITNVFTYNSPDCKPNNLEFTTTEETQVVPNKTSDYYISSLCSLLSLNLAKLGSGEFEITGFRYYNNFPLRNTLEDYDDGYPETDSKTILTLNYTYYKPNEGYYNQLKLKIYSQDGQTLIRTVVVNDGSENDKVRTSSNTVEIPWAAPSDSNDGSKIYRSSVYKVEIVGVKTDNSEKIINDNYWIMTTTLFNNSYNFNDPNYVDNYCFPTVGIENLNKLKNILLEENVSLSIKMNNSVPDISISNIGNDYSHVYQDSNIENSFYTTSRIDIGLDVNNTNSITIDYDKYPQTILGTLSGFTTNLLQEGTNILYNGILGPGEIKCSGINNETNNNSITIDYTLKFEGEYQRKNIGTVEFMSLESLIIRSICNFNTLCISTKYDDNNKISYYSSLGGKELKRIERTTPFETFADELNLNNLADNYNYSQYKGSIFYKFLDDYKYGGTWDEFRNEARTNCYYDHPDYSTQYKRIKVYQGFPKENILTINSTEALESLGWMMYSTDAIKGSDKDKLNTRSDWWSSFHSKPDIFPSKDEWEIHYDEDVLMGVYYCPLWVYNQEGTGNIKLHFGNAIVKDSRILESFNGLRFLGTSILDDTYESIKQHIYNILQISNPKKLIINSYISTNPLVFAPKLQLGNYTLLAQSIEIVVPIKITKLLSDLFFFNSDIEYLKNLSINNISTFNLDSTYLLTITNIQNDDSTEYVYSIRGNSIYSDSNGNPLDENKIYYYNNGELLPYTYTLNGELHYYTTTDLGFKILGPDLGSNTREDNFPVGSLIFYNKESLFNLKIYMKPVGAAAYPVCNIS